MVFSSTVFAFLFLPIVLALNFALTKEIRNVFLVLASLVFYAWGAAPYVPLLIGLVAVNWLAGILIDRAATPGRKQALLVAAIVITTGGLIYFKYTNFIIDNL